MNSAAESIITKKRIKAIFSNTNFILFVLLIILIILGGFLHPSFLKITNLLNIARIVSLTGIMAVGMTFILLVGEIDLSVGSILSISAVVGGQFLHLGLLPVLLFTIGTGIFAGLINGLIIIKTKAPALIVTLGSLIIYGGLANIICGGKSVYPYNLASYTWIGQGKILSIPFPVIIFIIVTLLSIFVLNLTSYGRWIYFAGANRKAATYSGGKTNLIILISFVISGICASISGPMISSQINRIWPTQGAGYELTAITIAVLGGTSLWGGKGGVFGTFIAALIFGGLINLLNLTGVGTYLQEVVKGLLLIIIVGLMQLREWRNLE